MWQLTRYGGYKIRTDGQGEYTLYIYTQLDIAGWGLLACIVLYNKPFSFVLLGGIIILILIDEKILATMHLWCQFGWPI